MVSAQYVAQSDSGAIRRAFADEVPRYETPGKGTIRFRVDKDLPTSLVVRIVKARVAELRKGAQKRGNDVCAVAAAREEPHPGLRA
jgi:uncharacterized protein YdhG (YjbR/CyaY superfamily)